MQDDDMFYAHPRSLAGRLQRGRGLGHLHARQDPSAAAPFVYDAVRRDWVWDALVDERTWYLASLLHDLDLPLAPVIEQLADSEDACSRAADILTLLAPAGSDQARDALRAYIHEGAHWIPVLESLADHWPEAWWADLGRVARTRIGSAPELPWRNDPWLRFGITPRQPEPRPTPHDLSGLTDGQLLDRLAAHTHDEHTPICTLRELHRRDPAEGLIPLVPSLSTRDGRRPLVGLTREVERLGPLAVPAARHWARDDRPWLARLGRNVLADQAVREILPSLLDELAEQCRTRTWCGPEVTAGRLARFGAAAAGAAPDLRRLWVHTPHSYERTVYLTTLAAIGEPHGLDKVHTESLWDCQQKSRLLGIAQAPDNATTRTRLNAIRDDPMEAPEVRSARHPAPRRQAIAGRTAWAASSSRGSAEAARERVAHVVWSAAVVAGDGETLLDAVPQTPESARAVTIGPDGTARTDHRLMSEVLMPEGPTRTAPGSPHVTAPNRPPHS